MKIKAPIFLLLFLIFNYSQSQDTFSIVAMDSITGEVGSAGASCVDLSNFPGLPDHFLGELLPGQGAINTQAWYNQTNQMNARNRMVAGDSPSEIIDWLVNNDVSGQPELRQYGIVAFIDGSTETAAHTGSSTDDYKNHITGPNYSIQGNILLGQGVLDSMESRFLNAEGDLACKLMAAMQGANIVGADSRCTSNGTSSLFAFIKVAQHDDMHGNPSFVQSVRTFDGQGVEPIDSLQILFDNAHNCIVLGTHENESFEDHFSVFPNPFKDRLTIQNKGEESYDLDVFDARGNILFKTSLEREIELDGTMFSSGILFIKISNGTEVFYKKVIRG